MPQDLIKENKLPLLEQQLQEVMELRQWRAILKKICQATGVRLEVNGRVLVQGTPGAPDVIRINKY